MTKHDTEGKLLRLSQAAAAAGVSKQTVEYYIMLGLIKPIRRPMPGRQGATRRLFDSAIVSRIRLINRLNASGYTLQSIRETFL